MPAVRALQKLNQLDGAGSSPVRFQISGTSRMVGHDAVDPAQRIAVVEIDFFAEFLGDRFRRLDDLTVNVGEVEIAVGRIGEVAWPKPYVGRGQELHVLFRAAGAEGCS